MKYLAKLSFFVMMLFAGFAVAACGDDDPVAPPVDGGGDETGGETNTFVYAEPYSVWGSSMDQVKSNMSEYEVGNEGDVDLILNGKSPVEFYRYFFNSNGLYGLQMIYEDEFPTLAQVREALAKKYQFLGYDEEDDIYLYASEDQKTGVGVWEELNPDNGNKPYVVVQLVGIDFVDEGGGDEGGGETNTFVYAEPYRFWGSSMAQVKSNMSEYEVGYEGDVNLILLGKSPVEFYGYFFNSNGLYGVQMVYEDEFPTLAQVREALAKRYQFLGYDEEEKMYVYASEDQKTGVGVWEELNDDNKPYVVVQLVGIDFINGGGGDDSGDDSGSSFSDPFLGWGSTLAQLQAAKDENLFDAVEKDEEDPNITYAGYYGVSPVNYEMYMFDSNVLFGCYIEMKSNNVGSFENVLNILKSRYTFVTYDEEDDIYLFISPDYVTMVGAYEVNDEGTLWSCVEYYDYEYMSSGSSAPAKAPAVKNGKKTHFKNVARFVPRNFVQKAPAVKNGKKIHFKNAARFVPRNFVQKAPAFKVSSKIKGFKNLKF